MNAPAPGKLVIVGDGAFAEIACEYFTHDSPYEVVAFAVERGHASHAELAGLPVVDFEDLAESHPPDEHSVFAALTYTQLNRLRARLSGRAKEMGYALASYVSSRAFVWRNAELGEHCFVFEDNTVQPFVRIGDDVVLWSGNHIGHHSVVGDHCFVSSHVVISGNCRIGEHCFLGVNSTLADGIEIGRDTWVGPHCVVTRDVKPASFIRPARSDTREETSFEVLGVEPD